MTDLSLTTRCANEETIRFSESSSRSRIRPFIIRSVRVANSRASSAYSAMWEVAKANVADKSRSRGIETRKKLCDQKLPSARSCALYKKCREYDARLTVSRTALWWLCWNAADWSRCSWTHSNRSLQRIAPRRNIIDTDAKAKRDDLHSKKRLKWSNKGCERLTIIWKTRYDPSLG